MNPSRDNRATVVGSHESRPSIPGIEVELAGQTFIIPPLTLGQLRGGVRDKMKENDRLVGEGQWYEALDIKAQIIAEAMRRNYPHMTPEDVADLLDLKSYARAWNVVLGGSGLLQDEVPPSSPPTNGTGTSPSISGTSDPSTEPSSEPTAGPTAKSTVTH